jgi:hypothetical protein
MTFLDIALQYAARGWYVHPLAEGDKKPITPHGFKDATTDPGKINGFWMRTPAANIGIACGFSDLFVVDADHGLASFEDFEAWRYRNQIPYTYTVRTGRRTSYAVQMYFRGAVENNGAWELDGVRGEIRSIGGYVMAAPSIHPDSKEAYAVLIDEPLAPRPSMFQARPKEERAPGVPLPILGRGEGRHPLMMQKLGEWHRKGLTESEALGALLGMQSERFSHDIPLPEMEKTVRECWAKWQEVLIPATVSIGIGLVAKPPAAAVDWRGKYHSFAEMDGAALPTFIIEGFLQKDVIGAVAAPVAQRKSLIAANVAHACLTGEALFGHFAVTEKPSRVLYLCPEMGLLSFTDRLRKLGLLKYVGDTLFCRTMNSEGNVTLADLTAEELAGALVIVDTAVRFIAGDENSSADMRIFAESCFGLMQRGAASVLVLFHSGKGTKESSELTLENAMRGSGELGAFISSCWATRLQDPDEPYKSASYLKNVKQRDFESKPFEVVSDANCRLTIVAPPGDHVKLNNGTPGTPRDADGREAEALEVIRDNPTLGVRKVVDILRGLGIKRGKSWVGNKRFDVLGAGVKVE